MVGATMIENEETERVTARSVVDLINSAYAIHPAFAGGGKIVEMGCDVRPAFPDNLPRITRRGRTLYINGLYRTRLSIGSSPGSPGGEYNNRRRLVSGGL